MKLGEVQQRWPRAGGDEPAARVDVNQARGAADPEQHDDDAGLGGHPKAAISGHLKTGHSG